MSFTKNLLSIYEVADKSSGAWYENANQWCLNVAKLHNVDHNRVIGIVAVLSPRMNWESNKLLALKVVETRGNLLSGCLPSNREKANNIYKAAVFRPAKMIGGKKVRAFYANIRRPQTSLFVTIDTHAANAAVGEVWVKMSVGISKSMQARIVAAYTEGANATGTTIAGFQAIIWEWWRVNKYIPQTTQ